MLFSSSLFHQLRNQFQLLKFDIDTHLHDVQKVIVDLRLVAELELDLVEVGERVLHLEPLEAGRLAGGPSPRQAADAVGRHGADGGLPAECERAVRRHLLHDLAGGGLGVQLHGGQSPAKSSTLEKTSVWCSVQI